MKYFFLYSASILTQGMLFSECRPKRQGKRSVKHPVFASPYWRTTCFEEFCISTSGRFSRFEIFKTPLFGYGTEDVWRNFKKKEQKRSKQTNAYRELEGKTSMANSACNACPTNEILVFNQKRDAKNKETYKKNRKPRSGKLSSKTILPGMKS